MIAALKQFFSPSPLKQQAFDAYVQLVAQARRPVFYKDWQVEDTIDGRFDVIVLHLFLVIDLCEREASTREFTRCLAEAFFADMDRSLREMGSSDTGVGIRVKKMAQAFYGRLKSYQESIHDEALLIEALRRNVYREGPVTHEALASLAGYMQSRYAALKARSVQELMQGNLS